MNPTLFASLVAATVLVAGLSLVALVWWTLSASQERRIRNRLSPGAAVVTDFGGADANPLLQGLASRGKAIETAFESTKESARLMVQAGWRRGSSRMLYYIAQVLTPFVTTAASIALCTIGPETLNRPIFYVLLGLGGAMLGLLLPKMVLRSRAAARRQRLKDEVPLFIHVLVLLFESGLSTRQAFASLVREGRGTLPELGTELEVLLRQLEAGGELADALSRHVEMIEVPDLGTVLALLRQVERYGGEVKEPLLDTLGVLEKRRELDLREKVNILSGRMTAVMVLFFFPALMIFVAGPAWVSIIRAMGNL